VLVALAILAVVAALAWRGIDGMVRAREISQAALDRTVRLGTVLQQWERDLQSAQQGSGVPTLGFDGAHLRLVRETPEGLQLVVWSLRGEALWRWAGTPVTRASDLQDQWMRSQQLMGNEAGTLKTLEPVSSMQVYFFRGNGWSNAQSTGDEAQAPEGSASGAQTGAAPAQARDVALPTGVRLQLSLREGLITRDVLMSGQGY
jgi:general secretion pathway protein J